MRHDAFAACLVPGVFGAPSSDVLHGLGCAAVAGRAFAGGAVATAGVSESENQKKGQEKDLHRYDY